MVRDQGMIWAAFFNGILPCPRVTPIWTGSLTVRGQNGSLVRRFNRLWNTVLGDIYSMDILYGRFE